MALKILDNWFTSNGNAWNGTSLGSGGTIAAGPTTRTCSGTGTITVSASGTPTPQYSLAQPPPLRLNFPDQNGEKVTITATQTPAIGVGYSVTVAVKYSAASLLAQLDGANCFFLADYGNGVMLSVYQANANQNYHVPVPTHPANTEGNYYPDEVLVTLTIYLRQNLGGGNWLAELWAYIPTACPYPVCLSTSVVALSSGAMTLTIQDYSKAS